MTTLAVITTATLAGLIFLTLIMHVVAISMRFKKKEISAALGVVVVLYIINIIVAKVFQWLGVSNENIYVLILSFGLYTAFIYLFYKESLLRSFLAALMLSILTFIIMWLFQSVAVVTQFF